MLGAKFQDYLNPAVLYWDILSQLILNRRKLGVLIADKWSSELAEDEVSHISKIRTSNHTDVSIYASRGASVAANSKLKSENRVYSCTSLTHTSDINIYNVSVSFIFNYSCFKKV